MLYFVPPFFSADANAFHPSLQKADLVQRAWQIKRYALIICRGRRGCMVAGMLSVIGQNSAILDPRRRGKPAHKNLLTSYKLRYRCLQGLVKGAFPDEAIDTVEDLLELGMRKGYEMPDLTQKDAL